MPPRPGPRRHHHHHRGGGFMPYPFPIQYDTGPRELFVVDDTPKEVCNPTPPLKPVPGTYRKPNGMYCWPTPRSGAVGDSEIPPPTSANTVIKIGGLALASYVLFKLFSKSKRR